MRLEGCRNGKHAECKRKLQKFYFGPKNQIIWLEEWTYCRCTQRGCECKDQTTDKPKRKTQRRKK